MEKLVNSEAKEKEKQPENNNVNTIDFWEYEMLKITYGGAMKYNSSFDKACSLIYKELRKYLTLLHKNENENVMSLGNYVKKVIEAQKDIG